MRRLVSEHMELLEKITALENSQVNQDSRITEIYDIIKKLIEPIYKERKPVGFRTAGEKPDNLSR